MPNPIRLYRYALSAMPNGAADAAPQLPCELVDVDLAAGEHKTPAFLAQSIRPGTRRWNLHLGRQQRDPHLLGLDLRRAPEPVASGRARTGGAAALAERGS